MTMNKIPARDSITSRGNIKPSYSLDEMFGCLNPLKFDFGCIQRNLQYLFTRGINSIGMTCNLASVSPLGNADDGKRVGKNVIPTYYEGHCSSIFGGIQACDKFDSPSRSASTCFTKCTENGKTYISSGCDGDKIWCTCSGSVIL